MKHDELQEDLAGHLRASTQRMVWTNMQLGPVGSPRPDVYSVDKSFARFAADAYEVKVSMSDLRRDTTSGKWQSYRKFAHRVWFAFERGLAPLDEIPRECGVILRSGTGWRAARKPIAQVLDTLPRDAWMKLLLECWPNLAQGREVRPRRADEWSQQEIIRKRLGDKIAELFRDRCRAESSYEHATQRLREQAAELTAEMSKRREYALAHEASDRARLDASLIELGELLGLPREEIDAHRLASAIVSFRRLLLRNGIEGVMADLQRLVGLLPKKTEPA